MLRRIAAFEFRYQRSNPVIHVFAVERPEEGFEQVAPDLEDVYFQRLRQQARFDAPAPAA